ncbi:DNA-processing protein DprA [Streptomyces justiciae]|uniref:DNA-processing protein DprA n=1 Tax=Streptomyces justiciae TaxID=2780140 RepID=UPI0036F27EEF
MSRPSPAHDFTTALAEAGHAVTAALAHGVDSTAHQAAAKTGRTTRTVLARGLASVHPPHPSPAAELHPRHRRRRREPLPATRITARRVQPALRHLPVISSGEVDGCLGRVHRPDVVQGLTTRDRGLP